MASVSQWIEGARPRTLPAAFAPVAAGVGLSIHHAGFLGATTAVRGLLSLGLALALQVGVNYANDYSDGIRGTDEDRVGPFRLTGSGAAPASTVKRAAFLSFGIGGLFGLVLVALAGAWWMLLVGVACVLAAWFYTGGKRPYGYLGFGEVMVFIFFGLVAVMGTSYLITGRTSWEDVLVAAAIGLLACAVMLTNNLRDIPTDEVAGKRTLAVRLGDARTRRLFAATLLVPFLLVIPYTIVNIGVVITLIAVVLTVHPLRLVVAEHATGRSLIPVLGAAGKLEAAVGLLLLIGPILTLVLSLP
ncbi:1,4-dihydroxy-2-naphthoate polyprenyltransferase [Helcobacillus sp. ACRRO]|uniref:1,4-dihydroxy-2-naphthoate polyprenyltransferase n=1 Tax=Helcobacillus sp. ACRRO TaxID=2918202 RepID=UPI001EF6FE32|nr:1,4-dihydroxy-2-naphthoate polyprenyltransferase [Helcobacillus sp. ACRRO]